MNAKKITLLILAVVFMGFIGCAKKKIVYTPQPSPPPMPTLAEKLDDLYQNDLENWRIIMKGFVLEERKDLPEQHLRYAIREFNHDNTRKPCMNAAFLLLQLLSKKGGHLYGEDHELLDNFAESSVTNEDPDSLRQLKQICQYLKDDEMCNEIRK